MGTFGNGVTIKADSFAAVAVMAFQVRNRAALSTQKERPVLKIDETVIGEVDRIQARVVRLVAWFNARSEFEAALRAQGAIVALGNIHGGDASMEEPYEPDGEVKP